MLSRFPTIDLCHIRIKGTGSLSESRLVDFAVVYFFGYTFCGVPIFGHSVQCVISTVMMYHASANIIAVAVPFCFIALGLQYAGNIVSYYLITSSWASPSTYNGKGNNNAFDFFVQVASLVFQPVIDFICLLFIADLVGFVLHNFPLKILVIHSCCVVQPVLARPNHLFHTF